MSLPNSNLEWVELGKKLKLLSENNGKITYTFLNKTYNFKDPEELVRGSFYVELIHKYKYPIERIDLEVTVPRRQPSDLADIVVFHDNEKTKPYLVVECKKDGISQSEIRQAVEQAFGNSNSLRSNFTILVSGSVRIAYDVSGFPSREREKNIIADIPQNYGNVIKKRFSKGNLQNDLRVVTEDELVKKFKQCHDTLWEGGRRNPAEAFDEMSKLMFCKIHDERFLTQKGKHYSFQIGTHETIKEVASRIRNIYSDAHKRDPLVFGDSINVDDIIIYNLVEILQGISLSKTELDAKGVAFEHFLGSVFRGEMGQYFTPRSIVKTMVEFLEPTDEDRVIDPACGSGGFLIYVMEKVRKQLEKKLDSTDAHDAWIKFAQYKIFGIEINSQLSRVAMMNMILHEDGHSNIKNSDSLDDYDLIDPRGDVQKETYSLLFTNPPFGSEVKEKEKSYLKNYDLGSKTESRNRQKTEVLFLERCLELLQPDGRMGIILPDGILTNSTMQYVRDYVMAKTQILAIISLPSGSFSPYGAGVKTSLVFLRKKRDNEELDKEYPIFMAIADHIGYDATGRNDKNEFPEILEQWRTFQKNGRYS